MFIFDFYFIVLIIPALIFPIYSQIKVSGTFNKYKKYKNSRGITGAEVAAEILRNNGIYDVRIERIRGRLTDHYNPRNKVLRLSEDIYDSTSVAAVGVAAHESGHAIQHKVHYGPLVLRSSFVPIAGIGSSMGPILAIVGLLFSSSFLLQIGIVLYAAAVLFYLITLPVEFNASTRAIATLSSDTSFQPSVRSRLPNCDLNKFRTTTRKH